MKKIVNGVEVEMTPAEEAARLAEEAAWAGRHIPTFDELDQAELNRMLVEDGSVMRAVMEMQFGIIKGVIKTPQGPQTLPLPNLTKGQYAAAIRALMRTP